MKIEQDKKLNFDDVMLAPQRSTLQSRKEIQLERTFQFYHSPKIWTGIPVICANMASLAGEEMCRALQKFKCITPLHKYHTEEELVRIFTDPSINTDYVWMTIGFSIEERKKAENVCFEVGKDINFAIEVANGHIDKFVDFCSETRKRFPYSIIMAGNVACPSMVQEYIIRGGVDIVKCGIGSGSVCLSTSVTGIGYPQFSLLSECSHVAHGLRNGEKKLGLVCSDGGCKTIGDICKGFAGGSDFLMTGKLFAGTEECCGEWEYKYEMFKGNDYLPAKHKSGLEIQWNGISGTERGIPTFVCDKPFKKRMKYYGMSSKHAQEKHCGEFKNYRASEGKEEWVNYKGFAEDTVNEICGGLRSCCTYSGAHSLKDLNKTAKFIVVK